MKKTALDRLDNAKEHLSEFIHDIYICVSEYRETIPDEWVKAIKHFAVSIEGFKKEIKNRKSNSEI